jgi:hypothetical protein
MANAYYLEQCGQKFDWIGRKLSHLDLNGDKIYFLISKFYNECKDFLEANK